MKILVMIAFSTFLSYKTYPADLSRNAFKKCTSPNSGSTDLSSKFDEHLLILKNYSGGGRERSEDVLSAIKFFKEKFLNKKYSYTLSGWAPSSNPNDPIYKSTSELTGITKGLCKNNWLSRGGVEVPGKSELKAGHVLNEITQVGQIGGIVQKSIKQLNEKGGRNIEMLSEEQMCPSQFLFNIVAHGGLEPNFKETDKYDKDGYLVKDAVLKSHLRDQLLQKYKSDPSRGEELTSSSGISNKFNQAVMIGTNTGTQNAGGARYNRKYLSLKKVAQNIKSLKEKCPKTKIGVINLSCHSGQARADFEQVLGKDHNICIITTAASGNLTSGPAPKALLGAFNGTFRKESQNRNLAQLYQEYIELAPMNDTPLITGCNGPCSNLKEIQNPKLCNIKRENQANSSYGLLTKGTKELNSAFMHIANDYLKCSEKNSNRDDLEDSLGKIEEYESIYNNYISDFRKSFGEQNKNATIDSYLKAEKSIISTLPQNKLDSLQSECNNYVNSKLGIENNKKRSGKRKLHCKTFGKVLQTLTHKEVEFSDLTVRQMNKERVSQCMNLNTDSFNSCSQFEL